MQLKKLFGSVLTRYGKIFDTQDPVLQAKYYCFNIYSGKKLGENLSYMYHNHVRTGLVD